MSKRKGRQRETDFRLYGDAEFMATFYNRRHVFEAPFRERVEREAKARGLRNIRKRRRRWGGRIG